MKIQLLSDGTLPENQAVITCERVKTCDKVSIKKEGSTDEFQLDRVCDRLNCSRLKQKIDDKDDMDCNELIAYWMMEGYLGHVDSVKEAYKKGHDLFMDFKYVKMPRLERYEKERFDSWASDTNYKRYRDFRYTTLGLGFVDVFNFHEEAPKFGKLVPDNGALTTLREKESEPNEHRQTQQESCSCLLLDGNEQGRHIFKHFTKSLKHFAYFNPRANIFNCAVHGLKPSESPQCPLRDKKNPPELLQRQPRDLKPSEIVNLEVLVLRGCAFLEEIDPCIGEMEALTVLEISDSSSIKSIPNIFRNTTKLRSLNLSYLAIETLPKISFGKLIHLRWIILRGCSKLTELPSTRDMKNLELIDLYGAISLKKLSTTNFRKHSHLKLLDLSNTHATRVPLLFDSTDNKDTSITHLFLRNCLNIYVFDIVENLLKLEVLDVSGCKNLKQINVKPLEDLVILDLSSTGLSSLPKECFEKLIKLKIINLSNTNIISMPRISHLPDLLRLIVHGCESLETLELEGLEKLQFLDVSGCKKRQGWGEIPFGKWPSLLSLNLSDTSIENFTVFNSDSESSSNPNPELHLQVLDLSNTSIEKLPPMSHFKSLKQLLLAGCPKLSSVPDLELLTKLEVLDLSGTAIKNEILEKAPSSLQKLLLKGCSGIEEPLPLGSLTLLQELDLRGTDVAELPEDIARMPHLKCIRLPHKMDITRVDWTRMKDCHLDEIYWDQLNIFESVKVLIRTDTEHSMSAKPSNDSHLFRLVDSQGQWEAYFKQFQFTVPPKEGNGDAGIHFGGVELVFKGHHPLARKEPYVKPQCPAVEIHGFSSFPKETTSGLEQAVNVALVSNSFISSLSDEYFKHMKAVKVCWINSCTEMKSILGGENQNAGVLVGLETLVLSNLASLESFCAKSENAPSQSTESVNLKHMYVDCCPVLDKIISPSHLPENLETLHIKFCDQLVTVCGDEPEAVPGGDTSNVANEPVVVPGGNTANAGDENLAVPSGNTSDDGDENEAAPGGNTSDDDDENEAAPGGNTSDDDDEPQAVSGGNNSDAGDGIQAVPGGEIEAAASGGNNSNAGGEIQSVPGGETEAASGGNNSNASGETEPASGGNSSNDPKCSLSKLRELSLLALPKLQQIGADLPFLRTLKICQCPELKVNVFNSIMQCARSKLTRLILDCCPQLKHVLSSSMLPENLEILDIRSCDGLENVFDSPGSSLDKLRNLKLWNLPQLQKIQGNFPSLETWEIKYCSRLPQALCDEQKLKFNKD